MFVAANALLFGCMLLFLGISYRLSWSASAEAAHYPPDRHRSLSQMQWMYRIAITLSFVVGLVLIAHVAARNMLAVGAEATLGALVAGGVLVAVAAGLVAGIRLCGWDGYVGK